MASKNISIREDLYDRLTALKHGDESFSELIERLLNEGTKGSTSRLMKYFGAWSELPTEIDQNIKNIRGPMNENLQSRVKEHLDDISG